MAKKLILASGSASRKEIMDKLGVKYSIDVSDYEEDMTLKMEPKELAIYLSRGKAEAVAKRHKDAVILAADSFAVYRGSLLGKPHTKEEAINMLKKLSGTSHQFITGFTIIDSYSGKTYSDSEVTTVYFRKLTPEEIDNYVSKEDVVNTNAGAYRIHGLGAVLVSKIDGTSSNAQGLPISKVAKALKDFGVEII